MDPNADQETDRPLTLPLGRLNLTLGSPHPNGPKMDPKWTPKWTQNGTQNGPKTDPTWDPKRVSKGEGKRVLSDA